MIILVTYFIGQVLQILFHLSIPDSVIGLILLFLVLQTGVDLITSFEIFKRKGSH